MDVNVLPSINKGSLLYFTFDVALTNICRETNCMILCSIQLNFFAFPRSRVLAFQAFYSLTSS